MKTTTKSRSTKTTTSAATKAKSASHKANEQTSETLKDFFTDEIKDIYWAEKHLTKALPKMQKAASSEDLANAFADHLTVTQEHVSRLEKVFELLDETARGKKCEAMEGLVKEGEGIIEDTEEGTTERDLGLILAAQKIEHYEIATYGALAHIAEKLNMSEIAEILQTTLGEEKEADETLTSITDPVLDNSTDMSDEEDAEEEK